MSVMNVPGLAGYIQAQQQNQAQGLQQLQQAQVVLGIQEAQRKVAQEQALRAALMQSGGDAEKAIKIALESGNSVVAAQLSPLAKLAQERRERDETVKGMRDLYAPPPAQSTNPMVPGPGASVMAGSGTVVPAAAPAPSPSVTRQQRLDHLQRMSVLYANNPTVQSRIQSEIGKSNDEAKTEKEPELSPLGKLIRERNKYAVGSPEYKVYDQAITKYQPGGVQVNVNPNDPLIPGKTAQNKIDEGLLDTGMRLQTLSSIERQFKPEYQQLGTRWNALKLSVTDKIGLTDLDPGQRQFLTDFSQYKRNSIDALNQYIKSVTGAAMTNAEAERILRGLPNPGTGLFDGDSPTEFKAKLEDATRQVRMAEARFVYIKRNGLNLGDVGLDRMPGLMNKRGAELEAAIKKQQPTLPEADVRRLVKRNLAQEFGLVE